MIENKGFKLYITRGDDVLINVNITQHLADGTEASYEMQEGDTLTLTVKHNSDYTNAEAVLQKVYTSNQVAIFHDDTKDLDYGLYLYDIVLKNAAGHIYTLILDTLELTKEGGL